MEGEKFGPLDGARGAHDLRDVGAGWEGSLEVEFCGEGGCNLSCSNGGASLVVLFVGFVPRCVGTAIGSKKNAEVFGLGGDFEIGPLGSDFSLKVENSMDALLGDGATEWDEVAFRGFEGQSRDRFEVFEGLLDDRELRH